MRGLEGGGGEGGVDGGVSVKFFFFFFSVRFLDFICISIRLLLIERVCVGLCVHIMFSFFFSFFFLFCLFFSNPPQTTQLNSPRPILINLLILQILKQRKQSLNHFGRPIEMSRPNESFFNPTLHEFLLLEG